MSFILFLPFLFMVISAFFVNKLAKSKIDKKFLVLSQIGLSALVIISCFVVEAKGTVKAVSNSQSSQTSEVQKNSSYSSAYGMGLLAASLAIGLAGIGAGVAIASGIPAAIVAATDNPDSFGKIMIFMVFAEAIALYGLVISVLVLNKLDLILQVV